MKTITLSQKLQLAGLLLLAEKYSQMLKDIEVGMAEIVGTNDGGHIQDAVYCDDRRNVDDLLRRLKIEVIAPMNDNATEKS